MFSNGVCILVPPEMEPVDKPQASLCFKGNRSVNSGSTPGSGFFALATKTRAEKIQVFTQVYYYYCHMFF